MIAFFYFFVLWGSFWMLTSHTLDSVSGSPDLSCGVLSWIGYELVVT